jgi:methanogenic corrinoid protein MtbC1
MDVKEIDELRVRDALTALHGGSSPTDLWRTALTMSFYAGDLELALGVLREASADIAPVAVLDDILAPSMHDIGALWERNEITVADEHLATAMAHQLLAAVAPGLVLAPARSRETILLATPATEGHTMGLLMANDVLYGAGYRTVLLGAGVPDVALGSALLRHRPRIVAVSSTMDAPDEFAAVARVVGEALPEAQMIIGGKSGRAAPSVVPTHNVDRLDGLLAVVESILG